MSMETIAQIVASTLAVVTAGTLLARGIWQRRRVKTAADKDHDCTPDNFPFKEPTIKALAMPDLPITAFEVGYYQFSLSVTVGMSSTSVWIPISKATAEQLPTTGYYEQSINMGKRMSLFLGPDKRVVGKIFQMLPDSEAVSRLPSKASDISEEGAEKLLPEGWRNAGVIFAHGYTGNCYDMYRMCERLARRGFVVIAPNFADSSSNATLSVTGLGPAATAEGVILRMHTVDCVLKYMGSKFGISSVGLLGYSLGTDTIRYHQMRAPRVYIAGPGWTKARDPETVVPERPEGPSMLLVSMGDHGPPPPPGTANESGYPDRKDLTNSMLLGMEKLPEHSQHIHQTIPYIGFQDAHVVETDEAHIGSMTLGMMKLCPEKDGDLEQWTAFNGGCVELFFNQFL